MRMLQLKVQQGENGMYGRHTSVDLDRNKLTRFLVSPNVNLCQASYSNRVGVKIVEDFPDVLAHVGNEEPFYIFIWGWVTSVL